MIWTSERRPGGSRRPLAWLTLTAALLIALLWLSGCVVQIDSKAKGGAGAGDGQDVIRHQIGALSGLRRMREGTVMAHVAAQLGQWNKNLGAVCNQVVGNHWWRNRNRKN